ncbi:hypothetical protein J6590_102554 [Homalodisca vitripennis]|nr:hypothetical protein J6590_102554 [Homalodisca vitripennis]
MEGSIRERGLTCASTVNKLSSDCVELPLTESYISALVRRKQWKAQYEREDSHVSLYSKQVVIGLRRVSADRILY